MSSELAHQDSKVTFGFWVYLMTDCILFACLFATYAVLRNNTAGGEAAVDLFSMPFVLVETLLLLVSSFTCGLALLASKERRVTMTIGWLIVTLVLGAFFVSMEVSEFAKLLHEGNGWQRSGFLSAFFTLVGTHGLHICIGILWAVVLVANIIRHGLKDSLLRKLKLFSMFWHFLDVVWIFIFTIVYLMGALQA